MTVKAAVIIAKHKDKMVFVRKENSQTWEVPGGRLEPVETIFDCAVRELVEETGATKFMLMPIKIIYNVESNNSVALFFAEIFELPKKHSNLEICEVQLFDKKPECLTYPQDTELFFREKDLFLREWSFA